MRIDGYYNREPIGLSDNPEETTFSFDYATIPLVWLQMKFFLLCMARRVHKMFTKKISTRLLIMEVDFCPVLCIPEVPVLQAFRGISHFVWYCKAVSDLS